LPRGTYAARHKPPMSRLRHNLLSDLPHRLREHREQLLADLRRWGAEVREDPTLLWRTAAVRVGLWVVLGVVVLLTARALTRSLVSLAREGQGEQAAPVAILRVACASTSCRHTYTSHQPMDFAAWPMVCPRCGQATVYRAKLCPKCHRWYGTVPGAPKVCPLCSAPEAPGQPDEQPAPAPENPDDAEDPWG